MSRIHPRFVCWFPLAALVLPLHAAPLRIQVVDNRSRPLWTRLEVRGPGGQMFQPAGAIRDPMKKTRGGGPWYPGSFIVHGVADLDVPPGDYLIVAEHGLEYERIEKSVSVSTQNAPIVRLRLRPWIRMRENGWWSADMHVHRPLTNAPAIAQAEDLNLIELTDRDRANWFRADHWPAANLQRVSDDYWLTARNAEDERRGGAWIFHGVKEPLDLGPVSGWFPPGVFYIRQVRAQRAAGAVLPWFDLDMPFWWEVPVVVALEPPDSLDILHNQFMQYGIDAREYWGKPRDQLQFPGAAGFVDYCLGLYYRYLNLGFRIPPSAGTGSGVMPNPVGYDRIYGHLDGPFSLEKFYAAIRDGKSFVSNGPMLFTTPTEKDGTMRIDAAARAREPIDRIELVANGQVLNRAVAKGRSLSLRARFSVDAHQYSWCAVRCFLRVPDNVRLAHSSPIYLQGTCDARPDAAYFIAWIDELLAETAQDQKRFRSEAERNSVVELYQQARKRYQSLLETAKPAAVAPRG